MIWKYFLVGLFASVKFLFAPFSALAIEGNTWQLTYLFVCSGGILGVTFFYYSASFLMERAAKKRLKSTVVKKKFTKVNKAIIKVKHTVGIYGLALLAPLIISIPVGTIISAKFFHHKRSAIFILYGGVLVVGAFLTTLIYAFNITI